MNYFMWIIVGLVSGILILAWLGSIEFEEHDAHENVGDRNG